MKMSTNFVHYFLKAQIPKKYIFQNTMFEFVLICKTLLGGCPPGTAYASTTTTTTTVWPLQQRRQPRLAPSTELSQPGSGPPGTNYRCQAGGNTEGRLHRPPGGHRAGGTVSRSRTLTRAGTGDVRMGGGCKSGKGVGGARNIQSGKMGTNEGRKELKDTQRGE